MASKSITIVDYGMGNIGSVVGALRFLGVEPEVTPDPERVKIAHSLILPGVGSFRKAMGKLKRKPMTIPWMAQFFMGNRLMPMPNPINVLEATMDKPSHGLTSPGPLQAKPKQTNPNNRPLNVAMISRFISPGFLIMPERY